MAVNNELNLGNTPLPVIAGGQGNASLTAYAPLCGGTTSTGAVQSMTVGTNNQAVVSGGAGVLPTMTNTDWINIQTQQLNSVATVDFINLSSDFIAYKFALDIFAPVTDGVNALMLLSTDNGSTFITSASAYTYRVSTLAAGLTNSNSATATEMWLAANVGNVSTVEFTNGEIILFNPMDSGTYTSYVYNGLAVNSTGVFNNNQATGYRNNAEANNAVRFLFSSGNVASANITMYGMRAT